MKNKSILFLLALCAFFYSCKSTEVEVQLPEIVEVEESLLNITKYPEAMFWEINGYDSKGEKSTIYIFGTYHLADEKAFPLPEIVETAWTNSNRYVCELSMEDWTRFPDELNKKINESIIIGTGKSLIDELTQEELITVVSLLGDEQAATLICYEPWVLSSVLAASFTEICELNFEYSYDSYFINLAKQQEKELLGLDTLETQMKLNCYGDWDIQLDMLKEQIAAFNEIEKNREEILDFYNAYLSSDEEAFSSKYFDDIEKSKAEKSYYGDYIDSLLTQRNLLWTEQLNNYLLEGGVTFVFAGCGHFTGIDSVQKLLQAKYLEN